MDTVNKNSETDTLSKVRFKKIEELPTMEDVRQYLNWDAQVNPLPGEVKWFTDDKRSWDERRQAALDRRAAEKEEKRIMASNPNKPRVPNQKFLLVEFLAEKEAKHPSEFLGMFQAAMMERKLRSAPLATYNKLWDKFLEESNR